MSIRNVVDTENIKRAAAVSLALILTACGGGGGGGGGGGTSNTPDLDPDQVMFDELGVDTTQTPRELDHDNNPNTPDIVLDDETYNPLGTKVSKLHTRHELFLPGFTLTDSNSNSPILEHTTATYADDLGETKLCYLADPDYLADPTTVPDSCIHAFTEMNLEAFVSDWWTNELTTSVSADLDGNGVNEIVNVYITQTGDVIANIITRSASCNPEDLVTVPTGVVGEQQLTATGDGGCYEVEYVQLLANGDFTRSPMDDEQNYDYGGLSRGSVSFALDWFRAGIIAADVDGDGSDEIVSVAFDNLDVFAFSKGDTGYQIARESNPLPRDFNGDVPQHTSIARGRFSDREIDDLERDDLVIAASTNAIPARLYFYDQPVAVSDPDSPSRYKTNLEDAASSATLENLIFSDGHILSFMQAFVATGDLDNDGTDEIVLNVQRTFPQAQHFDVLVFDRKLQAGTTNYVYEHIAPIRLWLGEGIDYHDAVDTVWSPVVKVFWPEGPGTDAVLYVGSRVFEGVPQLLRDIHDTTSTSPALNAGTTPTPMHKHNGFTNLKIYMRPKTVAVADVYGDRKESIVAVWGGYVTTTSNPNPIGGTVERVVKDAGGNWVWEVIAEGENTLLGKEDAMVTAANIDHDSPVVEFVGHTLQYTDPQVIAVLAAPPTFGGPDGNSGNTIMTNTATVGSATSNTFGLSIGRSISFKSPDDALGVPIPTYGIKYSIDAAVQKTETESKSIYSLTQYRTENSDDAVVFMVTPVDVYWYRAVNAGPGTEPTLSINVPREPDIMQMARSAYNQAVPAEFAIGSNILGHTVGDPASYPGSSVCVECTSPPLISGTTVNLSAGDGAVGNVGVGSTELEMDTENATLTLGREDTLGYAGWSFTNSIKFSFGMTTTVTRSTSTDYRSLVTSIPAGPNTSRGYEFGMFVYYDSLPDNPFTVVNYWTENVNP